VQFIGSMVGARGTAPGRSQLDLGDALAIAGIGIATFLRNGPRVERRFSSWYHDLLLSTWRARPSSHSITSAHEAFLRRRHVVRDHGYGRPSGRTI